MVLLLSGYWTSTFDLELLCEKNTDAKVSLFSWRAEQAPPSCGYQTQ